jgi:hypothetical protein
VIDIVSISDKQAELVRDRGTIIVCNSLPELQPHSYLRPYLGNSESIISFYVNSYKEVRKMRELAVGMIESSNPRFVAFQSERGEYRSPMMATIVGQELCERGHRVLLSHYSLAVPAEELVPTRRSWGEYQ